MLFKYFILKSILFQRRFLPKLCFSELPFFIDIIYNCIVYCFVLALSSPVLCDAKINDNDNDNEMTITIIIILIMIMIMIMISIHSTFLKDSYSYTLLNILKTV